ncbi:MAG: AAA family ATPase, partial [Actinomycetota bacterium]|nr:AAA family ATPase [Actinomycetota bacterium]
QRAESTHAEEERRVAALQRAAADRREGLVRLTGRVDALRSRAAAAREEVDRLHAAREQALGRAERARRDFTALETRVAGLDAGEQGLDAEYEAARSTLDDLVERLAKRQDEAASAERDRVALVARREALDLGLTRKDAAGALLAARDRPPGLVGSVADVLSVRSGYEAAVAAALGPAADAVAVGGVDQALAAIERLKADDLGRAGIVVAGGPDDDAADWPPAPAGTSYAVDVVEPPVELRVAIRRLLSGVVVVDDLAQARALLAATRLTVAVTRDGDLLGAHYAAGGSVSAPSRIEVQAAVAETSERLAEATRSCAALGEEVARLEEERTVAQRRVDVGLAKLHESDAALAAVAEELGHLGSLTRSANEEAARLAHAIGEAEAAHERDLAGLADLETRLRTAQQVPEEEPDTDELTRLSAAARAARQIETEARLALLSAEERARAMQGHAERLRAVAEEERQGRAREESRRARRRAEVTAAEAVRRAADVVLARLEQSLAAAAEARADVERARAEREQELSVVRERLHEVDAELSRLTDAAHRDEMARAEQRLRIEQLEERAAAEVGLDAEELLGDYGPDVPVPAPPAAAGEDRDAEPEAVPFVRGAQEQRLRTAERQLAVLGTVNPLALEEFSALEERHRFLGEQLDDVRKTRRDLLGIVREVDDRVEGIFAEAFADVAREFAAAFPRLFPGGEGRLLLTEPDDLLTTGIEVEARPPGKKVKRLSLLSGGERALVAVAFLVALFKARPSPFYVLDEVEAALDDTNLGRLLRIYEELRQNSQLVVITHQKRTMEVADALYGVSMRADGVTTVISQRLREPEPA